MGAGGGRSGDQGDSGRIKSLEGWRTGGRYPVSLFVYWGSTPKKDADHCTSRRAPRRAPKPLCEQR